MKANHKSTERSFPSSKNERTPWVSAITAQSHIMTGGMLKIGSEGRATRTSGGREGGVRRGRRKSAPQKKKARGRSPLPAGLVTPLPRILRHPSRSTCAVERKSRLTLTETCRDGTAARHAP